MGERPARAIPGEAPHLTAPHLTVASLGRFLKSSEPILSRLGQHPFTEFSPTFVENALFLSGLHPLRPGSSLQKGEKLALYFAMRHLKRTARLRDPCLRCGAPMERLTMENHSINYCAGDQPREPAPRVLTPQPLRWPATANTNQEPAPNHIFCLIGPPSAGKTTLSRLIVAHTPFTRTLPVVKTRKPRHGEMDGVDGFYVRPEDFESLRRTGGLELTGEYYGRPFGIPTGLLFLTLSEGDDPVLIISPEGAQQIRARFPNTCIIGVLPPSLDVLLERIARRKNYSAAERRVRRERVERGMPSLGGSDFTLTTHSRDQALRDAFDVIYAVRCQRLNTAV